MNIIKAEAEKIKQCDLMNYENSEIASLLDQMLKNGWRSLDVSFNFSKIKKWVTI